MKRLAFFILIAASTPLAASAQLSAGGGLPGKPAVIDAVVVCTAQTMGIKNAKDKAFAFSACVATHKPTHTEVEWTYTPPKHRKDRTDPLVSSYSVRPDKPALNQATRLQTQATSNK